MLHAKVRELLVSFVRNNANKFRVYVTEGSLEDHILNMQYIRTWGTQVELYAAASLFQKEIYVFTPTLRKDGTYTWIKIPPYPPHVELVFPPRDYYYYYYYYCYYFTAAMAAEGLLQDVTA